MTESTAPIPSPPAEAAPLATPVIVDMGKKKRKAMRRLRKGRAKAMSEVMEIVEEVREQLGDQADGTTIVPVVVIYGRKRQRRRRGWL
jgi:hypothetical protein